VLSNPATALLLALESVLLLVLCLRKFPMPAAADVGDKSVFLHLEAQRLGAAAGAIAAVEAPEGR
jgi:hypothetical protein